MLDPEDSISYETLLLPGLCLTPPSFYHNYSQGKYFQMCVSLKRLQLALSLSAPECSSPEVTSTQQLWRKYHLIHAYTLLV